MDSTYKGSFLKVYIAIPIKEQARRANYRLLCLIYYSFLTSKDYVSYSSNSKGKGSYDTKV
jgi:hypothetical protein